jgi:anti-sigma regulatory factor (Ser/Thr protein kinase)
MRISIENNIQQMTVIHAKLREFYSTMSIEKEVSNKISITIDEVVSNIIQYGYEDNEPHHITLLIEPYPSHFKLEFIDDGKYFDPLDYLKNNSKSRDLDQTGGVGLPLINKISSGMKYHRTEHKNNLIITIPY